MLCAWTTDSLSIGITGRFKKWVFVNLAIAVVVEAIAAVVGFRQAVACIPFTVEIPIQLVCVVILRAIVTEVTDAIAILVNLQWIWLDRAIVTAITDAIAIFIVGASHGQSGTGIADITDAITILVSLVWVGCVRTIISQADVVSIGVTPNAGTP